MFNVEIIADSVNQFGNRIVTPAIVFPRIVLSEFNTHKMISKNSASSRAIPPEKMLRAVKENPFIPLRWQKEHTGMQGFEYYTSEEVAELRLVEDWLEDRDHSVMIAERLGEKKVTKQIINRLLERYMWHKVVCTATEWENFFALRAHQDAEIHIQKIAFMMIDAFNEHEPKKLSGGEWHVPYGDRMDEGKLAELFETGFEHNPGFIIGASNIVNAKIKIATARSARTSYTVIGEEGKPDNYGADIKLHDVRLIPPGHNSPMEHANRAMTEEEFETFSKTIVIPRDQFEEYKSKNPLRWYQVMHVSKKEIVITEFGWCQNMRGFIPYRYMIPNENRTDTRLKKDYLNK